MVRQNSGNNEAAAQVPRVHPGRPVEEVQDRSDRHVDLRADRRVQVLELDIHLPLRLLRVCLRTVGHRQRDGDAGVWCRSWPGDGVAVALPSRCTSSEPV